MVGRAPKLLSVFLLVALLAGWPVTGKAVDARFDLLGPKIEVKVTRVIGGQPQTLPIASVPNLLPGDKLWIHPDLPPSQSVHYLLICAFLRGTTNPPPESWFNRIESWKKEPREEGVFITVPAEAQQVVLFLAPETGGDFSTLKSAVMGRPGVFVRASQDLAEAGFEQARIEKYLSSMRRVPPADADSLQKHSDLLARTLALKPNADCAKRPVDVQFTCLTQTGTQTLLDDGHAQSIASMLSSGPNSDLIQAASYTGLGGGGVYSAYVGAVVDLVRVMANLHTAHYQYIPAIAFPQGAAMNLRLNTPPSFHNPKSVLVIGLPAIQAAHPPPLRPADANSVSCLLEPSVVLPIEGAPLVFSTDLAHDLRLHLDIPAGEAPEPDIPLLADAFQGGLVLARGPEHRRPLHLPLAARASPAGAHGKAAPADTQVQAGSEQSADKSGDSTLVSGVIQGHWGFDSFTGPRVTLQRFPGTDWHLVGHDAASAPEIIAGRTGEILLASTGTACVHTISARPAGAGEALPVKFLTDEHAPEARVLTLLLPQGEALHPGELNLAIQQFGQPSADVLAAHTFRRPAHIETAELHAGDRSLTLTGTDLGEIASLHLGDLLFTPATVTPAQSDSLRLSLPKEAPQPPTHEGDRLQAEVQLRDGRVLPLEVHISAPRPAITLLGKSTTQAAEPTIALVSADDLPINAHLTFTLKLKSAFPRDGQVEVATVDGTLRTVLTLAPSGGLLLQDPHTIVASLDPLSAFGPSAFGALEVRVRLPAAPEDGKNHSTTTPEASSEAIMSDWVSLGTLVRLPVLSKVQCPLDASQPCTVTGTNLFLLDAVAADPSFGSPTPIPDGFTGTTLTVPHLTGGTLFLKLRDDPGPVNSASPALSTVSTSASTAHKGHVALAP